MSKNDFILLVCFLYLLCILNNLLILSIFINAYILYVKFFVLVYCIKPVAQLVECGTFSWVHYFSVNTDKKANIGKTCCLHTICCSFEITSNAVKHQQSLFIFTQIMINKDV